MTPFSFAASSSPDNGECFFEIQTTGDDAIKKDGVEVILSKIHVADVIMTIM